MTLDAHDVCGNITTHQFTITVQDSQAPVWDQSIPLDATVECDAIPDPVAVSATDNCTEEVEVVFTETITDGARECRPAHSAAAVTLGQNQLTLPESVGQLTALPQWRSAAVTLGRSDELTDECTHLQLLGGCKRPVGPRPAEAEERTDE